MKKSILIILMALTLNSFGQSEYNFYSYFSSINMQEPVFYSPKEKVDQINYTVVNKKGKTEKFIKKLNSEGKILSYSKISSEQKIIPISKFEYDKNGVLNVSKSYKKGKLVYAVLKKHNEKGKLIDLQTKKSKNEIITHNTWEYNSDDCLTQSFSYKKNGKINLRWEYKYYTKCQKEKTILYNGKGKVKNIWTYECKEEGEKLEKRKNETQVCKWEETTNNLLIKSYQSFDEKGRIRKFVTKYTIKDTLPVERLVYDGNDNLVGKTTYDKSYKFPLNSTTYKKGKILSERKHEYKDGFMISSSYTYKGKLKTKSEYSYKEGIKTSESYFYKGKPRSKSEYTYKDSFLTEYKKYGKNNVLLKTVKLSYGESFTEK